MHALLAKDLAAHGLADLGVCAADNGDALPEAAPGIATRALLLAGNAGSAFWPYFAASPEYRDGLPDPLNRWSARVLSKIAQDRAISVVFPFEGPPFHPFQQWAMRTGTVSRSPLGVLAHEEYGLWFAFRGAFLLTEMPGLTGDVSGGPCGSCVEKPCLDACPANALTRDHAYEVGTCRAFVAGAGAQSCGMGGCLIRHACPYGQDFAYAPAQASFHMRAFIGLPPR